MLLVKENPQDSSNFKVFLTVSDQLLVCDSSNDPSRVITLPALTDKNTDQTKGVEKRGSQAINCVAFSKDQNYIAVTTESKQLLQFDKQFAVLKNILLARVASKVCFTPTNDILVADRTGDVYLYKTRDEQNKPTLLLGHLSVISDILVTPCGGYVITCDRDEKIRVSYYPNAYNIAAYCLGHTEFVSSLHLITNSNILVSSSGDGSVRFWNYPEGKQVNKIDTRHLVSENLVETFAKQMDVEKVEIRALPIIDLQLYERESKITLALSLLNVSQLFLYSVDPISLNCSLVKSLDVECGFFKFCLSSKLYVLGKEFKVFEDDSMVNHPGIEAKLLEFKDSFFADRSDVSLWYKRRFDNVQEYLERKRVRLEAK